MTVFEQYEQQLTRSGLVNPGDFVMGFLDADLVWNQQDDNCEFLSTIVDSISINSIMFAKPAEPYKTIIDYLSETSDGIIYPQDCETRTFLHDLPVADRLEPNEIIPMLKMRKSVIVKDAGIITYGTVSLEQAFVTFSSVCFASFVKFFSDYLASYRKNTIDSHMQTVFEKVVNYLPEDEIFEATLMTGPFETEEEIHLAMDEAGKKTVAFRLVDSYFGNISYRNGDTLYISQTGSSLDLLPGCIDPCLLDGSSCASITASSELVAHVEIVKKTRHNAILHGHPKFSVILSMDCQEKNCKQTDECHLNCSCEREVCNIPIVPGEVGTGTYGLCNTVPKAIEDKPGVIVYGHGLFTTSENDFNTAFKNLLEIENACKKEYFRRLGLIVQSNQTSEKL